MSKSKLGVHITTGSRDGYGEVAPYIQGCVSFMADAFAEMRPEAFSVYRHGGYQWENYWDIDIMPGFDRLSPDDMPAQAAYWFPKFLAEVQQHEAGLGIKIDCIKFTNEVGGNDPDRLRALVAYERALMPLAEEAGYKIAVVNLATMSPDFEIWKSIIAPFVMEASRRGHIYSRHCYADEVTGGKPVLISQGGTPSASLSRLALELQYFRSNNAYVHTIIGELGFFTMPDVDYFMEQVQLADKWMENYPEIGFGALFTYGEWNAANIEAASPKLAEYLRTNQSEQWNPSPVPDPEPDNKYKIVVVKIPQEFSVEDAHEVVDIEFANRHTITASADDMLRLMQSPNAAADSFVKLYEPTYPSQEESAALLDKYGITWMPLYLDENSPIIFGWTTIVDELPKHPSKAYKKRPLQQIDTIAIHHTVSPSDRTIASIARYHVDSRGWPGIAYHFVIKADGQVFMTNYMDTISYHAAGHNDHTIGIALQGDFSNAHPPARQLDAAKNLVAALRNYFNSMYGIDLKVAPHRALSQTACPGNTWQEWLPYISGDAPKSTPASEALDMADMAVYFTTNADAGDIIVLANNWGGGDERQQVQHGGGDIWYITKNQQWERRKITEDRIYLTHDTSPGGGHYYTVSSPDGWMPRYWEVGELFTREETVQFFNKSDCTPIGDPYTLRSNLLLANQYDELEIGGIIFSNVVEVHWLIGGRADEKYWYAEGLGLVQWQKYDGKKSYAVERIQRGTQEDNTRETTPCMGINA